MCSACHHSWRVAKMIQVRNVPDVVHGTLKARAAREGMSLSDFVKRELERLAERPTVQEWLERTQEVKRISSTRTAARVIRELRDAR
jgi:antitoxin FitA